MSTHYETLNLAMDAGETDIKKAYRSLSLQWHPDRNSAPEAQAKFQEINEAYETLSDPSKREMYDAELNGTIPASFFRTSSMNDPGQGDMADINHILNMMFSGGFGHPGGNPGGHPGPNIHVFRGGGPEIFVQAHGGPAGFGHGGPPHGFGPGGPEIFFQGQPGGPHGFGPGGPHGFSGMPGFGFPFTHIQQNLQKPPPVIKSVVITFQQAYSGCTLPVEIEKWSIIEGLKISEFATIDLTVPPGVEDKEIVVLRDCGNAASPEMKGDVKLIITIEKSELFERQGMDLLYKKQLKLKESLCGFSFEIIHPNGKQLILNNMTNRTIIKPGFKKVIANMGMARDGNAGSLVIEFGVEYPDMLTPEQMTAIEAIL